MYTETKLNSAYAFGGPKCLVKVIQKLSGLSVNRFMAVDFAGFSKMVDALGGVEVCSTTPLEDYELGTVLPNAGRQMIDGHTALQYVRARQVTTETNGDYGRIKRQQLFLSSLLRSMISKEVFFSLSKLNNVVNMFIDDSYVDNIKTKDLVDLGQSIQGVNAGRITFVTVPTVGYADEYGNETPRTDDMRALFDAIINDDPLPEEKNADNTPVPGTPESTTSATPDANPSISPTSPEQGTAELVNAVTTNPTGHHRPRLELDGRGRAGGHRGQRTATAWLQRHHARRLPGAARSRRRCSSRRATSRRPRRSPPRSPTPPSSGWPAWATWCGSCSVATSTRSRRRRPAAHRCRSTSCTTPAPLRRTCPRI